MKWLGNVAVTDDRTDTVLSESILFDLKPEMTYAEKIRLSMLMPTFTCDRRVHTYLRASFKAFLPWEHAELDFVADLGGWK
jgi:hypothetical protein